MLDNGITLLCAGIVGRNTDAIVLLRVSYLRNCDSKLGKIPWISYGMHMIVPGEGYFMLKARIIKPL